jgi:hypothetical protein
MSDDGHAIGLPVDEPYRPGRPRSYEPYGTAPAEPYREPDPPIELDELVAAHAQGRRLAESGDLTGARTLLEEALQRGELRLGQEDPRLAPIMVDLATIARRLGNLTEAHDQLHRAHTIIATTAGADHPTSLSIEARLAAVIHRLGDPTDAHDRHLVDAGARVLGDDHPAVQGARQRLAARTQAPPSLVAGGFPHPAAPAPRGADGPVAAPAFAPPAVPSPSPGATSPAFAAPAASSPIAAPAASSPIAASAGSAPGVGAGDDAPTEQAFAAAGEHGFGVAGASPDLPSQVSPPYPAVRDHVRALPATLAPLDSAPVGATYAPVADGIYQRVDTRPVTSDGHGWSKGFIDDEEPTIRRRRGANAGMILVAALCAVVLIGGVLVALQLLLPDGGPTVPGPVTTPTVAASPAPTGVTIRDEGGSVTITWVDPSKGTVQFLVSGAREGNALAVLTSVPAGRTVATIYGLNTNYNYCFSVSAVWSADNIQESMRTCTSRTLSSGTTATRTSS